MFHRTTFALLFLALSASWFKFAAAEESSLTDEATSQQLAKREPGEPWPGTQATSPKLVLTGYVSFAFLNGYSKDIWPAIAGQDTASTPWFSGKYDANSRHHSEPATTVSFPNVGGQFYIWPRMDCENNAAHCRYGACTGRSCQEAGGPPHGITYLAIRVVNNAIGFWFVRPGNADVSVTMRVEPKESGGNCQPLECRNDRSCGTEAIWCEHEQATMILTFGL